MRFAMNILTPLAAFCLIGTAYECSAQEKHFDRAIVEKATEESPVAGTTLLAVRCDEQTDDPRLAHGARRVRVHNPVLRRYSSPLFSNNLCCSLRTVLTSPQEAGTTCIARWRGCVSTMWREFSSSDIVTTRVRRSVPRRLRSAAQKSFVSSWCVSTPRRTKLRASKGGRT